MPRHLASDRCWRSPQLARNGSVEKVGNELGRQRALKALNISSAIPAGFGIKGWAVNHTYCQLLGKSVAESAQHPEWRECQTWATGHNQELENLTCSKLELTAPRFPIYKTWKAFSENCSCIYPLDREVPGVKGKDSCFLQLYL